MASLTRTLTSSWPRDARPVMSRRDGGCGDLVQSAAGAQRTCAAYVEAPDPNINMRP